MAKIVILIEDKSNGELDVKFTSDTPLPEDYRQLTMAQVLAARLHEAVGTAFNLAEEHPDVL